jgi:hypothetical protein
MKRKKWFFIVPAAIVGMALFIFIGSELVKLLWNWLLPPLFGWGQITFWQAFGLLVLCRILFGGLGMHGGPRSNVRHRIRERMAERWEHLTPEEREVMRQRWRERCGFGPPASNAPSAGAGES